MKTIVTLILSFFMSFSLGADTAWIVQASRGSVSQEDASYISTKVYKKAIQHDIDPIVIFSIMQKESLFKRNAKNPDGSYGLMQIQAKVHRKTLAGRNPFDVDANLDIGIGVFKYCQSRWKTIENTLNCYNGRVHNNSFASKVLNIMRLMKANI